MIFGIGLPEMFVMAVVGLIVFGPERLPELAAKAAHGVRSLRTFASKAMSDLNVESASVTKTISDLQSLSPRAIVSDMVSSVVSDAPAKRPAAPRAESAAPSAHVRAVFDPDAT